MTPEVNDKTGAFIVGRGKTMSKYMYEMLKVESLQAETFVKTSGTNVVKTMLDADPELKAHLDKTTMLEDVSAVTLELRELLGKTGLGTDVLDTFKDEDIDEILLATKEKFATRRDEIRSKVEVYEEAISGLEVSKEQAIKQQNKEEEERIEKEIEEKTKLKTDAESEGTAELATTEDINRIRELVRKVRGFNNGFSAETYLKQMMFYADDVFGAKHLRSAEFRGLSDTFLVNSFEDTRNTINDDKLVIIDQIKKSDDNSKRILAANKDNLEDIMDIFIGEPYMNKEAQEHLLELYTQLKMDPEAKQPLMEHMLGGDYVADLMSSPHSRAVRRFWIQLIAQRWRKAGWSNLVVTGQIVLGRYDASYSRGIPWFSH